MSLHKHILIIQGPMNSSETLKELNNLIPDIKIKICNEKNKILEALTEFKYLLVAADEEFMKSDIETLIKRCSDLFLPLIIISKTKNKESLKSYITAGAIDIAQKGDYSDLAYTILREVSIKELGNNSGHSFSSRLFEAEARYNSLAEDIPEFQLCRWKPDTTITYANKLYARSFNLKPEEILNKKWLHLIKEDRDRFKNYVDKLISIQKISNSEYILENTKGVKRYFTRIDVPVFNQNGILTEFQSIIRDITDNKVIEERLRTLNVYLEEKIDERTKEMFNAYKDLESFSYSISHDLKSPIRNISIMASLLEKKLKEKVSESEEQLITDIHSSAKKMLKLIDHLLEFGKLGSQSLNPVNLEINDSLKEIIKRLKCTYNNQMVEVDIQEIPPIKADEVLIFQVFENILSNAFKYSSKKECSKIKISVNQDDDYFIFSIKDNGVGFDINQQSKAFEAFKRLHSNEEFEGAGVGLANSKKIIEKHHGKIWAKSEVGEGSTFYFSISKNL
ncbi:MAG: PAS domain-containing sensor histidine kinase [Chitinophagaceae bacterium]|nr:MAG: PAS domain-containing sensor histidine kinase [Chitinophagaceae bacterium]